MWQESAWRDPAGTPQLLTRWQELALWEEAISSVQRDILLNAHATAKVAVQAWQLLHAWEAPLDIAAFDATEDSAAFSAWMSRVRRRLRERDWITFAELPGALRARVMFDASLVGDPPVLHGFDEITAAERRLFDAIGVRYEEPKPVLSRKARAACLDTAAEYASAAVWARQKLEENARIQLGILVPDLASVRATVERIFDDVLHASYGFAGRGNGDRKAFSVSPGASLADAPMIAAALKILRLQNGLPREEASTLWQSPFLAIDPDAGAKLDVELRKHNVEHAHLGSPSIEGYFVKLAAAARALPERAKPSFWSKAYSRLLQHAGWPGTRSLTTVEQRQLEAWNELLSEFAQLDVVGDAISWHDAVSKLQQMGMATQQARETSLEPVQILDVSQGVGTRFDALWIAGMHAGAWPQKAKPNPFLPLALQRKFGMPGSSADLEFAAASRIAERLFGSAEEVVCSYPGRAAEEDQQPSPFIAPFPQIAASPSAQTVAARAFSMVLSMEPRPVDANLGLPENTPQRGGSKVLENQSACPFRAFAVHRLRAKEMDEPDVGLSALNRGNLIHRVLDFLWKELGTQSRLLTYPQEDLERLIGHCITRALDEYVGTQEPSRALATFRELEQARLERLVHAWLEVERGRPAFRVFQHEESKEVNIEGLLLGLRVDRIDVFEDLSHEGTYAMIDYKTSKALRKEMWMGDRPEAPQLPLYAVNSGLPIAQIAFGQLATVSTKLIAIEGDELNQQLAEWHQVIPKLARDFRNGHAEVDPREKPNPCEHCQLHSLCRVRELRRVEQDEDLDETTAEDADE